MKEPKILPKIENNTKNKDGKMSVRSLGSPDPIHDNSMVVTQNVDNHSIERIKTPTKFMRNDFNDKPVLKPIPYTKPVVQNINFNNDDLGDKTGDSDEDEEYVEGKTTKFELENDSLGSETKSQIGSQDSGFSDNELKNIITEKSNPELVQQIEKEFYERENLGLFNLLLALNETNVVN